MKCQKHSDREAVAQCQFCGKALCEECNISIAGKNYCEECMAELVGPDLASIAAKKEKSDEFSNPEEEPSKIPNGNLQATGNSADTYNNHSNDENLENDKLYENNNPKNISNKAIEEKYEKYLDDLYYDEKPPKDIIYKETITTTPKELTLSEQLAIDEAEHGSLTEEPYIPESSKEEKEPRVVPILSNIRNTVEPELDDNLEEVENNQEKYVSHSLHNRIHYKKEEEADSFTQSEIILTIILVILIILVVAYIVFLLTLNTDYTNFFDAVIALFTNPGELINNIFN